MDPMSRTPGTAAAVLVSLRADRRAADVAEARVLAHAVDWAFIHRVDDIGAAATWDSGILSEPGVPVAGPGAPLLADSCVAEFAAAVGLPTEHGKRLLGEAVELRYRLPRVWARVVSGDLVSWRARRIAQRTLLLCQDGAAFVDRQLAYVAHRISPSAVDRLVDEALARFEPALAEAVARSSADARHVTVFEDQVSFGGTLRVAAELDLADALDFEQAVRAGAEALAGLGCGEGLDARRAMAVGELSRAQLALELVPACAGAPRDNTPSRPSSPPTAQRSGRRSRQVVLYVHLAESAITGNSTGLEVARVENTRAMVTADQVREWARRPEVQVTIRPVIDLAEHVRVDQWEIPARIVEQVRLRDGGCVFPWCTRPARAVDPDTHSCDIDHVVPHDDGGPTCACNLAPLCRRHHRLKTHTGWDYTVLEPGSYLWTSPHGYQFLRDHHGTLDVSPTRPNPDAGRPPDQ